MGISPSNSGRFLFVEFINAVYFAALLFCFNFDKFWSKADIALSYFGLESFPRTVLLGGFLRYFFNFFTNLIGFLNFLVSNDF